MNESGVFWLKNSQLQLSVISLGGKITSLFVPDRNKTMGNVVLGYNSIEEYETGNPFFGSIIGRVANRIKHGLLNFNAKSYSLSINNPPNHLHGGNRGFHNQVWNVKEHTQKHIILTHLSKNGTENYPGNVAVEVKYAINDNEFTIEYTASSDAVTVLNLSHHSFFNLAGEGNPSILNHLVTLNANAFTPIDANLIPTGEIRSVINTPFDFRKEKKIALQIDSNDEQIAFGKGYDHNWVLNKSENNPKELSFAAKVVEPISGRTMEVWTTAPGLQFYTGNFLDGADIGKSGKPYGRRSALCLEPQHFPDAMNHPNFPSIILSPLDTYQQKSIFRFGTTD
jgi:aldose 1-epimerase